MFGRARLVFGLDNVGKLGPGEWEWTHGARQQRLRARLEGGSKGGQRRCCVGTLNRENTCSRGLWQKDCQVRIVVG